MCKEKIVQYHGSRERLRKMVLHRNGEFLEDQQFVLQWKPSRFKKAHRIRFRIRCRYEKTEEGYCIAYRIRPGIGYAVWLLVSCGFWLGLALWQGEVPVFFAALWIIAIQVGGMCWQWQSAKKEFIQKFSVVTKGKGM